MKKLTKNESSPSQNSGTPLTVGRLLSCLIHWPKFRPFSEARNKIFFGILIFGLIANLLVYSDVQYFYLRAIFSFIFLTTIPGLLMMLMLKIRKIGFWEYLVYTIGLSIAFLMFGGLLVNWVLPLAGINQPLSLLPISISLNLFMLIFGLVAYLRNKDISYEFKFLKLSLFNWVFSIIPITFPILSIFGTISLNNNGSNYLTMIMIGGVAIYVFTIMLFRNKLNKNIYPWAIFLIAISLVLMGSLRGWYISSTDAALEYRLFKLTLSNGFWDFWRVSNNSYNGMLSVTILPVVLSNFLKCDNFLISKLFFPLLFSFTPVSMYVLFKKIFDEKISFFGTLFYIFQPTFTAWTLLPPRQEIAFLFFSLILLTLFTEKLPGKFKNVLFLVFGFSMIVSHYSTSYLATAIFFITSIFVYIYKKWEKNRIFEGKIKLEHKISIHLSGIVIILLLLFEYFWYFQITNTGLILVGFVNRSASNINNIFNEKMYSLGNSPFEYLDVLGLGKTKYNPSVDLIDYTKEMYEKSPELYSKEKLDLYPSSIKDTSQLPVKENYLLYSLSEKAKQILLIIGGFLILLGLTFYFLMSKNTNRPFLIISIFFLIIFIASIIIPLSSTEYNVDRIYQQVLSLLAVFTVYGCVNIFKDHKRLGYITYGIFLILYFVLFTHAQYFFTGGREVQLRFANVGKDYDLHYVSFSELSSANWLFSNKEVNVPVVADSYASFKLYQSDKFSFATNINFDVLPSTIGKSDYLFSSRTNTTQKITFKFYGRGLLIYNFPREFADENKNLVYNNGVSEIYK
jgi:uncharacterized membrane protein